jgi:diadenylate cyclase
VQYAFAFRKEPAVPGVQFRLLDLIDIALITALLYQSYKLLIGSRAWNVVRGIVAVAIIWFFASRLELRATDWLFSNLAPVAFLGLVIVFQPELRAALERVGRGRRDRVMQGDPVQEIMNAVRELATQRKGALIAVEHQTPLQEYGQAATKLNAPVTAALLQTIFDSRGPLHDGAVIIKNDIVCYAGAIFPLSDKHEGWSVQHGTRHRAALGLSEVSDSIIVVVSEERGTVSLARNGELKTDIAPADVLKALREVYAS